MNELKMFRYLDLETCSSCNRVCPTCLRNSYLEREKVPSWFEKNYLPIDIIKQALDQCVGIGFVGSICLSHYNEPLMDERLLEIAMLAKSYPQFKSVFLNTNGDFLTEELAERLDGYVDRMIVSLYMDEPVKSKRKAWIETLCKKTYADVLTYTEHIPTHFSPKFDVAALAEKHRENPCSEGEIRVIINHRRQYLLCCDDLIGNFNLGTFPEISIYDYWFGEPHRTIAMDLRNTRGRLNYPHCITCPR